MFVNAVGMHPERLINMYFAYVFVLRAIGKARPFLMVSRDAGDAGVGEWRPRGPSVVAETGELVICGVGGSSRFRRGRFAEAGRGRQLPRPGDASALSCPTVEAVTACSACVGEPEGASWFMIGQSSRLEGWEREAPLAESRGVGRWVMSEQGVLDALVGVSTGRSVALLRRLGASGRSEGGKGRCDPRMHAMARHPDCWSLERATLTRDLREAAGMVHTLGNTTNR